MPPVVEKAPEQLPPTKVITQQTPEVTKADGVFEVFRDAARRFRFHLKAANGEIIVVSQSYGTKESALKGIASIKKNAPIAKTTFTIGETMPESTHQAGIVQEPVFEILCDAADKFRFHLKAANGEIIAASESYRDQRVSRKWHSISEEVCSNGPNH